MGQIMSDRVMPWVWLGLGSLGWGVALVLAYALESTKRGRK